MRLFSNLCRSHAGWTALMLLTMCSLFYFNSCAPIPQNSLHLYQKSTVIENKAVEDVILSKAFVEESHDPEVNNIKILHLQGTPYEMGFQHGRLIKDDIQDCIYQTLGMARSYTGFEAMEEVYDLMEPYIPLEDKEEMRGLAHGADIPLKVIHWFHAIPEFSEYGRKKKFKRGFKPTTCSNVAAFGKAVPGGELLQLRVLDWNRGLGVQKWPVILVHQPDKGNASVTFSFAGFIGCVSGMNDQHMAFGEMGYGDPPGETLEGIPFVFLFRKMMREVDTLDSAIQIMQNARRTCSYVYLISDVKSQDQKALLFVSDKNRLLYFGENTTIQDERSGDILPAIDDVVYGSAKEEILFSSLMTHYGKIDTAALIKISQAVAHKGNMQNVIFKPKTLETWVSNASNATRDEQGKACNQKWFYFDFKSALMR